ncbi:MAG: tetratricopeptide repeat protein [Sedimenticola thiotaurini]|uniref:Tetratricopeptide repeat protein n=1 Tax=Sedimenticola thiotaurini TaxID=1543721 RepID=A0A558CUG3_9GAMM|nr:MAG: tetratricopeptide repeat protein [Sedimenticola thiotaurini]
MSLINQMLRDLDKRETGDDKPREIITPSPVTARSTTQSHSHWSIWLLLAAVVVAVGSYLFTQAESLLNRLGEPQAVTVADSSADEMALAAKPVAVSDSLVASDVLETPITQKDIVSGVSADDSLADKQVDDVAQAAMVVDNAPPQTVHEPVKPAIVQAELSLPVVNPSDQIIKEQQAGSAGAEYQEKTQVKAQQVISNVAAASIPVPAKAVSSENSTAQHPTAPAMQEAVVESESLIQVKRVPAKQIQLSANGVYQSALQYLNEGRLNEAEEALRQTLILDQENHEARRFLVMLLMNAGEQAESISLLNEGMQMAPNHVPYVTLLSRSYIESQDYSKAIILLQKKLPVTGNNAELLALLGSVLQQSGQYAPAIQVYRQLVEQQPNNARAVAGLAIALDATGDYVQALTYYKQVLGFRSLPEEINEYARQRVLALSAER